MRFLALVYLMGVWVCFSEASWHQSQQLQGTAVDLFVANGNFILVTEEGYIWTSSNGESWSRSSSGHPIRALYGFGAGGYIGCNATAVIKTHDFQSWESYPIPATSGSNSGCHDISTLGGTWVILVKDAGSYSLMKADSMGGSWRTVYNSSKPLSYLLTTLQEFVACGEEGLLSGGGGASSWSPVHFGACPSCQCNGLAIGGAAHFLTLFIQPNRAAATVYEMSRSSNSQGKELYGLSIGSEQPLPLLRFAVSPFEFVTFSANGTLVITSAEIGRQHTEHIPVGKPESLISYAYHGGTEVVVSATNPTKVWYQKSF